MESQIQLPELDDDDDVLYAPSASTVGRSGGPGAALPALSIPSRGGPFRGAELSFHTRSGSGTSNDSNAGPPSAGSISNGATSAFRFPPTGPVAAAPPERPGAPRKSSFASLRAAIKGQQASSSATATNGSHRYPLPAPLDLSRRGHGRTDSALSAASRGAASSSGGHGAPSTQSASSAAGGNWNAAGSSMSRGGHVQHSSNYSEVSAGASSSTGSVFGAGSSMGGFAPYMTSHAHPSMGMPPMPPFPQEYSAHMPSFPHEYQASASGSASMPRDSEDAVRPNFYGGAFGAANGEESHDSARYLGPPTPLASASFAQSDYDYASAMPHTPTMALRRGPSASGPRAAGGALGTLPDGVGSDDPKTPAEYALNVLMSRWITSTALKMESVQEAGDTEPSLEHSFGAGADDVFDALLVSIAHVARKSATPVISSLFRWRALQVSANVDATSVRRAMPRMGQYSSSLAGAGTLGVREVAIVLMRRKVLMSAYLLARALTEVAKQLGRGSLGKASSAELEGDVFELMLECSRERTPRSAMQVAAFETIAKLLGELSKTHFVAIGDRFVSLLEQCAKAPASKEAESAADVAIQGLRHLTITVYPMELFEEGADFVEILSRYFVGSHGQRLKTSYADALTHLLLPVAKSASAEMNHPTWIKALETIGPRAFAMANKPRYWQTAYPLYVACLCAAPEEKFLQTGAGWSWFTCIEAGVAKLKDRASRNIVLNGAVRLIWTYMFRCRESSNTTTKRLEAFFRLWFPANRPTVLPQDAVLSPYIVMVHLALYRHFDYGQELVLEFLRHSVLGGNTLALQPDVLWKQRMTIAVRAVLLTLDAYVREESPPFPDGADFTVFDFDTEQRSGRGDELPEDFAFARPEIGEAQIRFNDLIGKIALICDHHVGGASVFDESAIVVRAGTSTFQRPTAAADEERYLWRTHPASRISTAYPRESQPYLDLLRACVEAWPRCLSSSIPFPSVLSALFRGHLSVDPQLAHASSESLRRIARQRKGGASAVVSGFMRYIFRIETVFWETHSNQTLLLAKVELAVKLWIEFLNIWLADLRKSQADQGMERTSAWAMIDDVEAHGLFLLCSAWRPLRRHAISVLRLVAVLDDAFLSPARRQALAAERARGEDEEPTRIIHLLERPSSRYCSEDDAGLTAAQRARVTKWRAPNRSEPLSELAESDSAIEHSLWHHVMPRFLRMCLERFPTTVAVFRSYVTSRALGMETAVAAVSGTSAAIVGTTRGLPGVGTTAAPALGPDQALMADHWKLYILALCTTTTSTDGGHGLALGHVRQPSEGGGERVIAARDLFQRLVPFLASEQAHVRDAVVSALGNININLYRTLLETTQAVGAQLNEDSKARSATRSIGPARRSRRHERLRTAVAHVVQLTSAHMLRDETLSDQSIVMLILGWVKDTFAFLTQREVRVDWEFHRLRRFFSGVVEEFFNGLARLEASERYFNFDTRLRMFRLFREWHSYSQAAQDGPVKLANLLASVGEQYRDDKQREQVLTLLRNETQLLSYHAGSAMAALCQGAISLVGSAAPAPMPGSSLDAASLLLWLQHLFQSPAPQNHAVARRALHALLKFNAKHEQLVATAVEHCFAEDEGTTSPRSFFVVMADVIVRQSEELVPLHQSLCLGLVKLGHPDSEVRRKAFELLDCVGRRHVPALAMHDLEVGVGSPLPATYLRAQREISAHLADRFGSLKVAMLSEYTSRLPVIDIMRRATTLGLLPEWLNGLELPSTGAADIDRSGSFAASFASVEVPGEAFVVLTNLMFLTIKYSDDHNFEIQDMWASLAEGPGAGANAAVIVRFLVEEALRFRSSAFVVQAKRAMSCLSHTVIAPVLFATLCALIEPSAMIPVPRDEALPALEAALQHLHCAVLDPLLPDASRRQVFSPGQIALLFVGELTYDRTEHLASSLPLLLHAIFMQVDSVSQFVQEQMMAMLMQIMRTLTSASGPVVAETKPEAADADTSLNATAKQKVEQLFAKGSAVFWAHDDLDLDLDQTRTPRTLRSTLTELLAVLHPLLPELRAEWGQTSLHWATSAPVRHMACRSFQTFRVLLPDTTPSMLADMLGRLSNTVSDPSVDVQAFALEVLYTLTAVVRSADASQTELLSQIFWGSVACLSTANEREFAETITLLESLLDKLDIGARDTIDMLRDRCPEGWEGEAGGLQRLILRGLRSSVTSSASFAVLARLASVQDDTLIDAYGSRLAQLFTAALPWFLQSTDAPLTQDDSVLALAGNIALLAEHEGKADLHRVATSIAKSRFRTKDDLVRQAVGCIRVNFLPAQGPDLAVLLLSLALNQHEWLRKQTLQVLKVFFQVIDTRSDAFANLGSELLMPLLRLLSSSLSAEALDVLDEPISINGGPAANQILRMSLQWGKPSRRREQSSDASIFGAPDDSGWAVAHPQEMTARSRINVQAVFKTCELALETAPVGEVNFVECDDLEEDDTSVVDLGLGGALSQLHALSNFFEPDSSPSVGRPGASAFPALAGESDEQVARILARSAARSTPSSHDFNGERASLDRSDAGNSYYGLEPSPYASDAFTHPASIEAARAAGILPSLFTDVGRLRSRSDSDSSSSPLAPHDDGSSTPHPPAAYAAASNGSESAATTPQRERSSAWPGKTFFRGRASPRASPEATAVPNPLEHAPQRL